MTKLSAKPRKTIVSLAVADKIHWNELKLADSNQLKEKDVEIIF